jgi:proteasome lid subunit RPN8/RPN11
VSEANKQGQVSRQAKRSRLHLSAALKHPVFDGIKPEELEAPEQPDPWWRRPLVIIIGIFLVVLIFSLSFSDSIMGIIQSKSLHNQELIFRNTSVIFEGDTLQQLQAEFISNEHREIKACLFGRLENGLYIVNKVEFPEIIRANVIHVVSVSCPIDALIDLHSHPINQCLASEQDISVYNKAKESNPQLRMMVMCSSTRFALV